MNEDFVRRHVGPNQHEIQLMLRDMGESSLDSFIDKVVPPGIRTHHPMQMGAGKSENKLLAELRTIAAKNKTRRSLIGMGYNETVTPSVILRNILENPGWYTQYTPYQSEISQGRLEALLNFQTTIIDLTGLDIANASLLDEATAAAEAMTMIYAIKGSSKQGVLFVSRECHPQTLGVVQTRARPLGIKVVVGDHRDFEFSEDVFGALLQYPASDGAIYDYRPFCNRAHAVGALVVVAADLLSLTLLVPPGEFGADVAVGNTQRFGVPMGYGGPHAAYFATHAANKRYVPGRIIGISIDAQGKPALRMALQTREQHIRREKATSNICTAQVLLAIIASMYAVYHGPDGLKRIAEQIHDLTKLLARGLTRMGHKVLHADFFDTLRIQPAAKSMKEILTAADAKEMNFRHYEDGTIGISLDEASTTEEVNELLNIFAQRNSIRINVERISKEERFGYHGSLRRTSSYLKHPVFNIHHSETKMLRYMRMLESRDLSLATSMIPLGSCTMKLNATTEMLPISWPEFSNLHPFAPVEQAVGYQEIFGQLSEWIKEITGLNAVSLQPNAGAQGEYTGLLVVRAYHEHRGEGNRNICLIPSSAHGTNPASAVMAGMEVIIIKCDNKGNIEVSDLKAKAERYKDHLAAFMVTYPSTHGVFEESIKDICAIIHANGGQVYMDGANLNAQIGLCLPAELGADVCHLNLHKTFCIPHGGGGPGMGPIGVAKHLEPFLPTHPIIPTGGERGIGPVSAAPWGSASILPISWAYIALMGSDGLAHASKVAILNANYMAKRLDGHYKILYKGTTGRVAHEFIVDLRGFKQSAGVDAEDISKRLIDYGFHAPTVSFPVSNTMMIEPTESEAKDELDRFCDAMISIREEIREIESGTADRENNVLTNAPHTAEMAMQDDWNHPYGREKAAFPAPWTRRHKFWPAVSRVNNAYGDRNFVCACPPVEEYEELNAPDITSHKTKPSVQ